MVKRQVLILQMLSNGINIVIFGSKIHRPQNIYNADETGLYYRTTRHGSLVYKQEALSGSKKAMDRMT